MSSQRNSILDEFHHHLALDDYDRASELAGELVKDNRVSISEKAHIYKLLGDNRMEHSDLDGVLFEYMKILELGVK